MTKTRPSLLALYICSWAVSASADIGNPQLRTEHPWYPGELAMSNFERLAETQAELWQRVTGKPVKTEEDRALASWFWRNTHFAHGEEGRGDLFETGFEKTDWNRDYWHGLFAHGFGLCGTTHAQWTAEMQSLLGHCSGRAVGVSGHNSFEVFLKGGAYGAEGRWVLLDHDISTVVFDEKGTRLISIAELKPAIGTLGSPDFKPERQRGWRVAGLYPGDIKSFSSFRVAEYFPGYAGPPPMVHLRKGESLRRYLEPGLEDGKTFVFWGRNYKKRGIPGPERSRSWVNQPEKMYGAKRDAGHKDGRVRYANAVFTYRPNFTDGSYREGGIDEGADHVTFEFSSPYVIAATPADDSDWGVYKPGCRNGLVIRGKGEIPVQVSTDRGTIWQKAAGADLTDLVKGHQQYWLRFEAGAGALAKSELEIRTVCQANIATIPRLEDGLNRISYCASDRALLSAGPNRDQALAHVVDGKLDSPSITLELTSPRGEKITGIHAASHNLSGNPPRPEIRFAIEYSTDAGKTWVPVVKDWQVLRRGVEPDDFWSQTFTYGSTDFPATDGSVLIRFSNDGGKPYRRVEAHLEYGTKPASPAVVSFAWSEGGGEAIKTASHTYPQGTESDEMWTIEAGEGVKTRWVQIAAE